MANQTYTLVVASNAGGQFAANVLHYQFDDAGYASTALAAKALIDAFVLANQAKWLLANSVHTALLSFSSRCVTQPGGFESVGLVAGGTVGGRAGNLGAAGLSPCIIWYPSGNSKLRGRTFLPGISDADCLDGFFATAFNTAVGNLITQILVPLTLVGGGGPVATFGVFTRTVPKTFHPAALGALSPMVAQVRRRQRPF